MRARTVTIAAVVVGAFFAGGVAEAKTRFKPIDDQTVIHGCYNQRGEVKLANGPAYACARGWTPISWNQTGTPGADGPQGYIGAPGADGTNGEDGADGVAGPTGDRGPKGDPAAVTEYEWTINYNGGTDDFVWIYGQTVIPAGTPLNFDPATSEFIGDVSACGPGGFFLVISADTGQDLDYGVERTASGDGENLYDDQNRWFRSGFEDGPFIVTTDRVLSWRAGCYTNIEGPVPPFTAIVRFATTSYKSYD